MHTASRLVDSLESFAEQEAQMLADGDYSGVAELLRRAAPVAERLVALAADPRVAAELRTRIENLLARRRQSLALLAEGIAAHRLQIDSLRRVRERIARIVLYSRAKGPTPRFQAAA